MNTTAVRTAWYRFHATFRRQRGGYLTVLVLVGLLGGLAMGALAGARRTLASPAVYIASTRPATFSLPTGVLGPGTSGYDPSVTETIAHLPHVAAVASVSGLNLVVLNRDGSPNKLDANPGNGSGSIDGAYYRLNQATVVEGRMPDPNNPHEFVANALAVQGLGLHVGQTVPFGIYTNAQTELSGFGTAAVPPYRRLDAKLVGIIVDPASVAADDIDSGTTLQLFSPALARQLLSCCANYTLTGVKVDGGNRVVQQVEREAQAVLPPGFPPATSTSASLAKAQRAVKPLAIALGVFGAIAGLVALLVAGQVIGRQIRFGAEERRILRALGADTAGTVLDGLPGLAMAIVAGSLLAVAVAVALSPVAPIGVIRPVYPSRGVSWDWTVFGSGLAVLVVGLSAVTIGMAYRQAPQRLARRSTPPGRAHSGSVGRVAAWGLPVPAVEGVRFALEPGAGRNAVPVRSAIFGTILAMLVMVTTVTFGSSLNTLVTHPNLYGWNWDYLLTAGGDSGNIPSQQVTHLLDGDHSVAAWSGAYFDDLVIDGQTVPVLGQRAGAAVGPPVLSGHGLESPGQVVLGAVTLDQLGKKIGDSVVVDNGGSRPVTLQVVGTATMPTLGISGEPHLEMGSGAVLSDQLIPSPGPEPLQRPADGTADRLREAEGRRRSASRPSLVAAHRHRHQHPVQLRGGGGDRATTGRDRELPVDGDHPCAARCLAGRGGGGRPHAHPGGFGTTPPTRPGRVQDPRFHPPPVGRHGGLAVERVGHPRGASSGYPWGSSPADGCGTCSPARSTPCRHPPCRSGRSSSWSSARWCSPMWWPPFRAVSLPVLRPPSSCGPIDPARGADRATQSSETRSSSPTRSCSPSWRRSSMSSESSWAAISSISSAS